MQRQIAAIEVVTPREDLMAAAEVRYSGEEPDDWRLVSCHQPER